MANLRSNYGIRVEKVFFESHTLVAGSTPEIDLCGATLCGVVIETELTSTSFTIQMATESGGTYITLSDGLAGGAAITYTIGATSDNKYIPISPLLSAGFRFCKIVFDQSETPTIKIAKRSME